MNMQQCWNGMGMDDQGRIYIGFTSMRADGREDFLVFRYDPSTGEKDFLGTFLDIVAASGNAQEGESIPKGHTRMIFANGKMYMGSQSFHDLKWEIDALPTYRGSHLFAFDTLAGTWQDLSAALPGGFAAFVYASRLLAHPHFLFYREDTSNALYGPISIADQGWCSRINPIGSVDSRNFLFE
jgi:hypothetical protein